ncbi:hypothetical protein LC612_35345 [Nostoc sp. CHAB 5834]|nr:hypothetical protein [Nostoc sp. CHAB 5834]
MTIQRATSSNLLGQWLLSALLAASVTMVALGLWLLHVDAEIASTAVWVEAFKGAPLSLGEALHLVLLQPWSPGYLVFLSYGHAVLFLLGVPALIGGAAKYKWIGASSAFGAMTGYLVAAGGALVVMAPADAFPYLRLPLGLSLMAVAGGSGWAVKRQAMMNCASSSSGEGHGAV